MFKQKIARKIERDVTGKEKSANGNKMDDDKQRVLTRKRDRDRDRNQNRN